MRHPSSALFNARQHGIHEWLCYKSLTEWVREACSAWHTQFHAYYRVQWQSAVDLLSIRKRLTLGLDLCRLAWWTC